MDAAILASTRSIGANDDFWIIGDFACCDTKAERVHAAAMFGQLPGRKHLVCGNYDSEWIKQQLPWASVHDLVEIEAEGRSFVLCTIRS